MDRKPTIIAMDLEGVLVPEIWIAVALKTGIEQLKRTTRDEPDYDLLMKSRIAILKDNNLKLKDIQDVINTLEPLDGAKEYINWLRYGNQLILLSDTYYEFAYPLMRKLGNPTLFCNTLEVDNENFITGYRLRQSDGKRKAVSALKQVGFRVIAAGDSYNDITMLKEADHGILFRPPANVIAEFPAFPVFTEYNGLKSHLELLLDE